MKPKQIRSPIAGGCLWVVDTDYEAQALEKKVEDPVFSRREIRLIKDLPRKELKRIYDLKAEIQGSRIISRKGGRFEVEKEIPG